MTAQTDLTPTQSLIYPGFDCYKCVNIEPSEASESSDGNARKITMNLYLMRHASAGVPRENPVLDAKRSLIKEGKDQCMLMARMLNAFKVQVDVIVSSPLKRAMQTAQFVGTEMGYEAKVEVSKALAPNASYADFQQMLAKYADREGILAVGHNPNVFQFLGKLVTNNGGAAIRMRKGSVARIDLDRHPPLLQWLIDPRMARSIYASVAKSSRPKTSRK
jgi:phosphohistidine phosphatase